MEKSDKLKALEKQLSDLKAQLQNEEILESAEPSEEEKLKELEKTIAIKQRDLADRKAIREAKKKFGEDRVSVLETRAGALILRAYSSDEFMSHGLRISKLPEDVREQAGRDFMVGAIVYPPNAQEILNRFPGTWRPLLEEFNALHDATEDGVRGKVVL